MELRTIKLENLAENVKEMLKGGSYGNDFLPTGIWIPYNIPYNKVLYTMIDGKLTAIRFLMTTFVRDISDSKKFSSTSNNYLIQTPYGLKWVTFHNGEGRFFETKEEYFQYIESGKGGFAIETEQLYRLVNVPSTDRRYFKECWEWDGLTAQKRNASIKNIIINEDGVTIVLSKSVTNYWSKEECVKANLDGMEIVDFPQSNFSVSINIEIQPNKPIVRTLKFVED